MTPEAMNRAIAEHLGLPLTVSFWSFRHDGAVRDGFSDEKAAQFNADGMSRVYGGAASAPEPYDADAPIPNYSGDLNVIVDAARSLPDNGTRLRYVDELAGLQTKHHPFFSTAEQCAEAYCRAVKIGKWKEAE